MTGWKLAGRCSLNFFVTKCFLKRTRKQNIYNLGATSSKHSSLQSINFFHIRILSGAYINLNQVLSSYFIVSPPITINHFLPNLLPIPSYVAYEWPLIGREASPARPRWSQFWLLVCEKIYKKKCKF